MELRCVWFRQQEGAEFRKVSGHRGLIWSGKVWRDFRGTDANHQENLGEKR